MSYEVPNLVETFHTYRDERRVELRKREPATSDSSERVWILSWRKAIHLQQHAREDQW